MSKISFFRFVTGIFIPSAIPIYVTMLTWKAMVSIGNPETTVAPLASAVVFILTGFVIFVEFEPMIRDYIYGKE